MLRKVFCIGFCLFFFISMGCSAAEKNDEWREKSFDFKAVKTVVVQLSASSDVAVSADDQKKLNDILEKQIISPNNKRVKFISSKQLEDRIGKLIATDMGQLRVGNNAQYSKIMKEYTHLVADGILNINIKDLKTTQVRVPAKLNFEGDYQLRYTSVNVELQEGGATFPVTKPVYTFVTRPVMIPAHNEDVGYAGAEFTLEMCDNHKKIWVLLDRRDGMDKEPFEMTDQIFQRAMDRLQALTS